MASDKIPLLNKREKIEEVFKKTFEYLNNNPKSYKTLREYLWIYYSLFELIPEPLDSLFSGHNFPISESYSELENSYNFALMGFYRYAFISLRSVLELGLLSVFFNYKDEGHLEIKKWMTSLDNTPFKNQIWDRIKEIQYISNFDNKFILRERIFNIFDDLSNYVHTKGYFYSSRYCSGSNVNNFNEKILKKWIYYLEEIIKIIIVIHICKYPVALKYLPIDEKFGFNSPLIGCLNDHQISQIKSIIPKEELEYLQVISDKDPNVIQLLECVNSFPDITEEELEKQRLDLDKFQIKNQGFENWYTQEKEMYNQIKDIEVKKRFNNRVKILKKWAIDNNYYNK